MNDELPFAFKGLAHVEGRGNHIEKFQNPETRIVDGGRQCIFSEALDQGVDEGGLAGSHIPGEGQNPFIFDNGVFQGRKSFFVLFAEPEKIGIRTHLERFDL